jgi:hypothetical protein
VAHLEEPPMDVAVALEHGFGFDDSPKPQPLSLQDTDGDLGAGTRGLGSRAML